MRNKELTNFERLKHISKSIKKIEKYSHTLAKEDFLENEQVQDAILLQFSIIGEAITHVEPALLDKFLYPWHKVRAFRNLIAHEYYDIKLEAAWDTIVKDTPELKLIIEQILKNEF